MPKPSDTDHLPYLAGGRHERADQMRHDEATLAKMKNGGQARLLRLDGGNEAGDGLGWAAVPPDGEQCFLGIDDDGTPLFSPLPMLTDLATAFDPSAWMLMGGLSRADAGLYATARSMALWHANHRFCSRCGGATDLARGGWMRQCTACEGQHFPRTDPVVIMLAECEGKILLGRQPRFSDRQYSVLAGFVEPGEGIEDAVVRELHEEAGIRAYGVTYVASQPWPFPSSLMIGCLAKCDDPALTVDETELEEAFWASRADVIAAMDTPESAPFLLPPPLAIAHHLIRHWLTETG